MHDKELLAIFEAFQAWCHYLKGWGSPIDVVTDHKNLEYFSTSEVLTHQQAQCHAPNTFGTVNMECTVDSRLSWSE